MVGNKLLGVMDLILVRYLCLLEYIYPDSQPRFSFTHFVAGWIASWEWVYNAADIDRAKIVWAREIPGVPLQPLLDYFPNRRVWIAEPDENPPKLSLYVAQSATNSPNTGGPTDK